MTEPSTNKSPADKLEEILHFAQSLWLRSRRYWPALAVSVVLAGLAAWAAPKYLKPKYKSEVVLTLYERMESSALLGLQGWQESSWKSKLRESLLSGPNLRDMVQAEGLYKDWIHDMGMPRTLERVRERISFSYGGETMFIIGYVDDDPSVAQRAARRLADQLTKHVSGESSDRVSATREFLQKEESRLRTELQATEVEYASFISQHPEFAPIDSAVRQAQPAKEADPAPSVAQDSTAALQRQANRLRARLDQLQNPDQAPALPPPPPPKPELTAESRAAIDAASREVKKAQDEYDLLKSKYTERHPDVIRAEAQLNQLRAQLQRIESAAWAEATAAMPEATEQQEAALPPPNPAEEESLTRQLRQVEAALHASMTRPSSGEKAAAPRKDNGARAIVDLETQFAELSRRQSTLRQQYALMQNRLFNANVMDKAQAVGGGTRLVIAEPAYLPQLPDSRGPRRTAAGAAAFFLLLGGGVMLGLGFLDQRILTSWDLTRLALAPVAVVIPPLENESHRKTK